MLPQALAAIDLALWDLRRAPRRRAGVALLGARGRGAGRGQRADRRRGPRGRGGRGRGAAARPASRCVKLKVGIGDDAGRLAAVRAAVGPDVAIRLDANGAWERRRRRSRDLRALAPSGHRAVRGAGPRPRGAARACADGAACRSRWTRPRPRPGALGRGARRRGVPEDRPLRRDQRRCWRRPRACARPAARSTSPRRSTGRSGSPPRCTPRRRCGSTRPCGLATLERVRRSSRRPGAAGRRRRACAVPAPGPGRRA